MKNWPNQITGVNDGGPPQLQSARLVAAVGLGRADNMRVFLITVFILNATAAFAGWRSIIEDSLKVPLVGEPQVTVLREGRVTVVRLKNATKTALQYSGYGSENPTTYWEEFRKGKWIQTHWPWCGTGLNDYSLAPGATISFRFSDDELKAGSRVYTIVRSVDGKRGSLILLCERLSSTKRSTE